MKSDISVAEIKRNLTPGIKVSFYRAKPHIPQWRGGRRGRNRRGRYRGRNWQKRQGELLERGGWREWEDNSRKEREKQRQDEWINLETTRGTTNSLIQEAVNYK